jgi:fatty-acyl-CoA synthase/long-chain acyl-CoA synthetase
VPAISDESPQADILTLRAEAHPEKLALIEDRPEGSDLMRVRWTFGELETEANRLANVLLSVGASRGDRVIWCGLNSPGVVRMMHAGRKLGITAVPLNYRLAREEATYVICNSDAVLVYCDADYADFFAGIRHQLPKVREILAFDGEPGHGLLGADALMADAPSVLPELGRASESAATMTYTSGTTGKPKGAVRRGVGEPGQVRQLMKTIGYRPDDIYLTTGPLYHAGPAGFMNLAHSLGNTVVVQRKFEPEDWLKLIHDHRVTTTFSAPTPVRMVCQLPEAVKSRYDRSSMRRFVANAAPWSYALKEAYLEDFPEDSLFEVYGSTEMGVNTVLLPADQRRKRGSCGQPAPGVDLALFDEEGREIKTPHTWRAVRPQRQHVRRLPQS